MNIQSIGVIDHWVNYPERFIRDGTNVLPDEIWVTDKEALSLSSLCFPGGTIHQQPNLYLDRLVEDIHFVAFEPHISSSLQRVLYVLEPIRHQ